MANNNYAQDGDPYGIDTEYTVQSAAVDLPRGPLWKKSGGDRDIRGNSIIQPRSLPTQAEADMIKQNLN